MKNLYEKLQREFFLIAGPCLVEDEHILFTIADKLANETSRRGIPLIFKASYKKANRTSIESPTGIGSEKALGLLQKVKDNFSLPILTDIHEPAEADMAAEVADILQIPAFLCRQTDLLLAAGKTNRVINIKKGQFMAPEDMASAAEKVLKTGNQKIMLTERGSMFGYHNLIVDFRSFFKMRSFGFPVVYDASHSLQQPSVARESGGTPELIPMMARAALATLQVDGLFIETHPSPQYAPSDSKSMLPLSEIGGILDDCINLLSAFRRP
jgi:2-dehydro-3-deoxyphosphooctonate aldolase (KDO 8-P synthase)